MNNIRPIFRKFDEDKNGSVSYAEFRMGLSMMGFEPVRALAAAPSASPTITKAPTPDDDDEAAWCDFLGKKNCARRRTNPWLFYGAPAALVLCLGACALACGAWFARRRRRDSKIADAGPRVRERVKPPPPAEPYRAVAFRWE